MAVIPVTNTFCLSKTNRQKLGGIIMKVANYKVRVLFREDGSYCGTYDVDYTGEYDSAKILREFYEEYPQFKGDIFLVSSIEIV